jgi:hypothetical protein
LATIRKLETLEKSFAAQFQSHARDTEKIQWVREKFVSEYRVTIEHLSKVDDAGLNPQARKLREIVDDSARTCYSFYALLTVADRRPAAD